MQMSHQTIMAKESIEGVYNYTKARAQQMFSRRFRDVYHDNEELVAQLFN